MQQLPFAPRVTTLAGPYTVVEVVQCG